jgi:molybdopterin/thiamine biosynthesis adenylyltransferase
VKDIVLVDEDKLELSNLNRWQGSRMDDIGKKKTDILKERLSTMAPSVNITSIGRSVLSHEAIDELKSCDCILGCVDTHHIRFFLNRFCTQYLIPYLDCSTGIIMDKGKIAKIGSRIATVIPSVTRCLDCSDIEYYKAEDVQNKFTDNETYRNLKRNKYIQDEDNSIHAPAVYPVNMLTCSILLMEFMNLFWGFKPVFWNTYLDYLSFSREKQYSCDQEMHAESPNTSCLYCNEYIGTGDSESLEYFLGGEKEIDLPDHKLDYTPPVLKKTEAVVGDMA